MDLLEDFVDVDREGFLAMATIDASCPSRPCSLCRRLSFRLSCLLRLSGEPFLQLVDRICMSVDRKRTCATLANVNGTVAFDRHDRFYSDAACLKKVRHRSGITTNNDTNTNTITLHAATRDYTP